MKRTNTAVWQEKYSRWHIKVQKDGIRKSFYSSKPGRTGQREANAKADAWLDDNIENPNEQMQKILIRYLLQLKETSSRSHYTQYEGYIRLYIIPVIGHVKICNLNENHLQMVINHAYSQNKLAKKTLMNIKGCLQSVLKYCRKNKYTSLVAEDLQIPNGATAKERKILLPNDIKILFKCKTTLNHNKVVNEHYIYGYRFAVTTGLRPGELLGLKWDDIDDKDIVHIKRAINKYGEITTGKNNNAQRSFKLTQLDKIILEQQKEYLNDIAINSEYIFPDEYGNPARQRNYYLHWKKYCINAEITQTSTYELRHTFVSAVKTLPEGYLKEIIGHSKDMDTYGVYSHLHENDLYETSKLINEIFKNILE